jgi:hypothetical protein
MIIAFKKVSASARDPRMQRTDDHSNAEKEGRIQSRKKLTAAKTKAFNKNYCIVIANLEAKGP